MQDKIVFTYQQTGFEEWLGKAAALLNTQPSGNTINIPLPAGKGFFKAMEIEPGLSFVLGNLHLYINTQLNIEANGSNGYLIYFRDIKTADKYVFNLDGESVEMENDSFETVFLTSSNLNQSIDFLKGTHIITLVLYADEGWVNRNINEVNREKLQNYVDNKLNNYNKEILTVKYRRILNMMANEDIKLPLEALFLKSRAMRMLEYVLNTILSRTGKEIPFRIGSEDMQKLMEVDKYLVTHYLKPFPSVEELAKLALMSETKLKKLFKQVFGMGLYEYYQKNRMHRVKDLLLSGKYKISELGNMLGYMNLSNFSSAFKKEFGFLPSEYKNTTQEERA